MSRVIIRPPSDVQPPIPEPEPPIPEPGELPTIAWSVLTQQGDPHGWAAQTKNHWDPVSGRILAWLTDGIGIYSQAWYAIELTINSVTFTRLGGTGGGTASCAFYPNSSPGAWNNGDGSPQQPWPADRHPEHQNEIDRARGHLYQYSGLACGNPDSGEGLYYSDLWRWDLNVLPRLWTKLPLTHVASPGSPGAVSGSLTHIPEPDVLFLHAAQGGSGFAGSWVYPIGTVLSQAQIDCGCLAVNRWSRTKNAATGDMVPPEVQYCNAVWDEATQRVIWIQTYGSVSFTSGVWAYDPFTQTWTDKAPANLPANQSSTHSEVLIAMITSGAWAGQIHYHRTTHRGSGTGHAADFLYNPMANTWSPLVSTGTGPEAYTTQVFVPGLGSLNGSIVAMEAQGGTSDRWWIGQLQ